VKDELERIRKETVVVSSKHFALICFEGVRKTMKSLDNVSDEIRIGNVPSTGLDLYYYESLLGRNVLLFEATRSRQLSTCRETVE
jgi:hypothetical protein